MSYYMICPNCGKGTIGRYATDNNLCGECSDNSSNTNKLSAEKLQEQLNTAKNALTNIKWRTERDELETYYVERNHDIRKDAIEALAAIGGDK
ncbi:hypothetical protein EFO05_12755 [Lactococcus lactis]|uniref:hypothetical protein n=1 Tax=Lactococcus lactis TaxID=1358 RepID=UPI0021A93190|nr:hypothetical protein [Lactococcus lactis]MCT3118668.1 hypothetical protein [Lactococcus lactis]